MQNQLPGAQKDHPPLIYTCELQTDSFWHVSTVEVTGLDNEWKKIVKDVYKPSLP